MKKINIGLIGFGTVGAGVVKILKSKRSFFKNRVGVDIVLKKICDKDIVSDRGVKVSKAILTKNINEIFEDNDINLVVELIGGLNPAKGFVLKALSCGKSVVTANKALIAYYGKEIFKTAKANNVDIYFEASVGGAIPIIKSLREAFLGNTITSMYGIVNGTCNYILSEMARCGYSFAGALKQAQIKGYAEANPALDINGMDSAHKIAILSLLAFGKEVKLEDIYTEGIENISINDIQYAESFGYEIKLLAIAKKNKKELEIRVHPTLIPKEHLLASVNGVYNAVYLSGDAFGKSLLYGEGAGQLAAASAVVSDIIDVARNIKNNSIERISPLVYDQQINSVCDIKAISSRYYMRFSVVDKSGVLAKLSNILGKYNISIANVIQKERKESAVVPVVMMSHKASEANVSKAIKEIDKLKLTKAKSMVIRIEE